MLIPKCYNTEHFCSWCPKWDLNPQNSGFESDTYANSVIRAYRILEVCSPHSSITGTVLRCSSNDIFKESYRFVIPQCFSLTTLKNALTKIGGMVFYICHTSNHLITGINPQAITLDGGPSESRTRDPYLARVVLSQLSYGPISRHIFSKTLLFPK